MDYFNSLPDIFVANIAGVSQYTTPESTDPEIPNAGAFVIQSKDAKPGPVGGAGAGVASVKKSQVQPASNLAAYGPPSKDSNVITYMDGSGAGADAGGSNAGSGVAPSAPANGGGAQPSYNNGLYTPTQPSATVVAPSQPASSPVPTTSAPSAPPSTFSTYTVPAAASAAPAYPTLSPSPNQGVGGPAPSASAPAPSGGPSSTCPTDGALVCGPDGLTWGLCNWGKVTFQRTSPDSVCRGGAITHQKRSTHVRRGAHGARKVRAA